MVELLFVTLLLNVGFGYWRHGTSKFSLKWFLAIHLPIPIIYLLRNYEGIGIWVIPLLVVIAVVGQILGGAVRNNFEVSRTSDTGGATPSK